MNKERLVHDLAEVLNRHCAENGSNTPDFIIAQYLVDCLTALDFTVRARRQWYGKELECPGQSNANV